MPPKKPPVEDDSDEEFEYDAPAAAAPPAASSTRSSASSSIPRENPLRSSHLTLPRKVLDQPYDEAVDVSASSADSVMSANTPPPHGRVVKEPIAAGKVLSMDSEESDEEDDASDDDSSHAPPKAAVTVTAPPPRQSPKASASPASSKKPASEDEDDEEDDEEDDDDEQPSSSSPASSSSSPAKAALYNAADFAHLSVAADVSELFVHITSFKAFDIELDTKFLPFIPDYIPAIGEIDPFLKVEPPEPLPTDALLGLTVVDEPSTVQSDPSTLELTLRVLSKGLTSSTMNVPRIERAEGQPKKVQRWVDSVSDLHSAKPQAKVAYTGGPMPDLETLMQAWPAEVEAVMRQVGFDATGLDLGVKDMAALCCAMMDIPVYGDDSVHESLHVLFSLYQEFSNNAHFQAA